MARFVTINNNVYNTDLIRGLFKEGNKYYIRYITDVEYIDPCQYEELRRVLLEENLIENNSRISSVNKESTRYEQQLVSEGLRERISRVLFGNYRYFSNMTYEYAILTLLKEVEYLDKTRKAFESLTPGGSEYYRDVDKCCEYIQKTKTELVEKSKEVVRLERERAIWESFYDKTIVGIKMMLKGEEHVSVSTGIAGDTTYGYGELDSNGYWQYPVPQELYNLFMETKRK